MSKTHDGFDWTDAAVAKLRQLWEAGLSTAEIGRRLGVSKNAVIGKSCRLNLQRRGSPIRRSDASTPRRERSPKRPTVPRLPAPACLAKPPSPQVAFGPRPPVEAPSARDRTATPVGRGECCWPIGDPGTHGFRFCAATALPGKPYCPEHADRAYARQRRRQDDEDTGRRTTAG